MATAVRWHRGMPESQAQSDGEHVPYPQGANTVSLRDVVRGGGGVPRKNVRCCTNALAPNLFMLRPRTIAAPVQWPSPWPYRCPHRVHHAPIALQPTHSCTNALAPNLFMLRPRTIAAPVQWPSPCRCPHRVHHGPIALQPTHGRPGITRKDCSRDALWSV